MTSAVTAATGGTLIEDGSTLNINGNDVTFKNADADGWPARPQRVPAPVRAAPPAASAVTGGRADGYGHSTVYLRASRGDIVT